MLTYHLSIQGIGEEPLGGLCRKNPSSDGTCKLTQLLRRYDLKWCSKSHRFSHIKKTKDIWTLFDLQILAMAMDRASHLLYIFIHLPLGSQCDASMRQPPCVCVQHNPTNFGSNRSTIGPNLWSAISETGLLEVPRAVRENHHKIWPKSILFSPF